MAEFDTLRAGLADETDPGPRFLADIPGDVNLAIFTFGPSGPVRHLRPFTEALAATMHQTRALFGDDALFQIGVSVDRWCWRRRRPGCGRRWPARRAAAALRARPAGRRRRPAAGFAHEDQDAAVQFRIRAMIEDTVGHPVDVSTSCGLGRREPGAALAAMDRIKLLLADAPAA
jgi:hypothetical protein